MSIPARSAAFQANCRSHSANPAIRITYDGTRYDAQVVAASNIHRDSSLSSGNARITLENTNGDWNFFKSTGTSLGAAGSISLKFAGAETLPLFTGTVMGVKYRDATAMIIFQDKFHRMLETRVGSGAEPNTDFTSRYPSDLAWDLLTSSIGELDGTASAANTDIDYSSWLFWTSLMKSGKEYRIDTRFTGQTIREILLRIAQLTDSYIWVNGQGKMDFTFSGVSGETYTNSNAIIDLDVETANMVNEYKTRVGYNHVEDEWLTRSTSNFTAGKNRYGVYTDLDEGKMMWHRSLESAAETGTHTVLRYGNSQRIALIETGLTGFLDDVGSDLTVSETLKSISSESMRVEDIIFNLNNGHTAIKARWPFV